MFKDYTHIHTHTHTIPAAVVSYSALAPLGRRRLLGWSCSSLLVTMSPCPEVDPNSPSYGKYQYAGEVQGDGNCGVL
eukprot:1159670-Pelagomonas_calceolata.AAC.1